MLQRRSKKVLAYQADLDDVRPVVEARSQGWCEVWLPGCSGRATQVHHRKLRKQGGDNSPANLLAACQICHQLVHAHPVASYEAGFLVSAYGDPESVPVITRGGLLFEDIFDRRRGE